MVLLLSFYVFPKICITMNELRVLFKCLKQFFSVIVLFAWWAFTLVYYSISSFQHKNQLLKKKRQEQKFNVKLSQYNAKFNQFLKTYDLQWSFNLNLSDKTKKFSAVSFKTGIVLYSQASNGIVLNSKACLSTRWALIWCFFYCSRFYCNRMDFIFVFLFSMPRYCWNVLCKLVQIAVVLRPCKELFQKKYGTNASSSPEELVFEIMFSDSFWNCLRHLLCFQSF